MHPSSPVGTPGLSGMTEREIDLLETVHHLLCVIIGDNKAYNAEWADYHARRAMNGMPQLLASKLDAAMDAVLSVKK